MEPVNTLCKAVLDGDNIVVSKMISKLNIHLDSEEKDL